MGSHETFLIGLIAGMGIRMDVCKFIGFVYCIKNSYLNLRFNLRFGYCIQDHIMII